MKIHISIFLATWRRSSGFRTYMEKFSESGMGGVCIEARPHPEFVKEGWWNDLDCIINKAKELSMKLWIWMIHIFRQDMPMEK